MADSDIRGTDVHDLSLGVIHVLSGLDVTALTYVQLRRLNAALLQAGDDIAREMRGRTDENIMSGDTVRISSPRMDQPR